MAPGPHHRRPPEALPVTLLTGFLGAGKTTLLNGWVRDPALARTVVVINEFGDVSLDHLLVEQADGDLLTLSSGCICCTVRGDLVALLEDLLRRRDNNRMAPFDRLVIETTGLAEPAPILNAIAQHPYLALRYRVDGVVTVVDALHGASTLAAHHEAAEQVVFADALVLTKTDLAPDTAELRAALSRLNPHAILLDAGRGDAAAAAVLHLEARTVARAAHDHHDHHHHDDAVSMVLRTEGPQPLSSIGLFLDMLRGAAGAGLLRAKGLLAVSDDPERPLLVQMVQGTLHPARRLPAWPDPDRTGRLVLIGRDLDRGAVERLWAAVFGPPAVDQPDAAALGAVRGSTEPGLF